MSSGLWETAWQKGRSGCGQERAAEEDDGFPADRAGARLRPKGRKPASGIGRPESIDAPRVRRGASDSSHR